MGRRTSTRSPSFHVRVERRDSCRGLRTPAVLVPFNLIVPPLVAHAGNSDVKRHLHGPLRVKHQGRALFLGEIGLLLQPHALFRPIHLRSDEEIDVDAVVIMKVNGVGGLGIFLNARSRCNTRNES